MKLIYEIIRLLKHVAKYCPLVQLKVKLMRFVIFLCDSFFAKFELPNLNPKAVQQLVVVVAYDDKVRSKR